MNYINHGKVKTEKWNLNLPINPFFLNVFINFFIYIYIYIYFFFFVYIKMSKKLSHKYCEENKERLLKKFVRDTKSF